MNFLVPVLILYIFSSGESKKVDVLRRKMALDAIAENSNKSIVVSPLQVRFSLCKLALFAQDTAKDELFDALGMNSDTMLKTCYTNLKEIIEEFKNIDLITVNKIIINDTNNVNKSFVSNEPNFGVTVEQVEYRNPKTSVSVINKGIERLLYKRITDVLELSDIDSKTSILIINIVYLKVTWEFPFDIKLTKNMKFHHRNGSVSMVPMMSRSDMHFYLDDEVNSLQIVNLRLASFGLTMTLVVPTSPRGLEAFLRKLSGEPDFLKELYKRMRPCNLKVMLPRFKIKTSVNWNKYLKKLGVKQIFNETNSGLDNILTENRSKCAYLSKCKQKNYLDIDEMGVFRQPVPEFSQGLLKDGTVEKIVADHPFYFSINLQTEPRNLWDVHELLTGIYNGPNT